MTILVTALASAWPFVARMTAPMMAPIGFMLPLLSFSTTSGLAAHGLIDGRLQHAIVGDDLETVLLHDLGRGALALEHECDRLLGELGR